MKVERKKNETIVILENKDEEYRLEQCLAYFEKPEIDEDTTEESAKELEDFGNDLNSKLDYTKFGKVN